MELWLQYNWIIGVYSYWFWDTLVVGILVFGLLISERGSELGYFSGLFMLDEGGAEENVD